MRILGALLFVPTVATAAFGASPFYTFPTTLGNAAIQAAAADGAGNLYVTGTVSLAGIGPADILFQPTSGAVQTTFNPGQACDLQSGSPACMDAFVAKFSAAGELLYATFLGGGLQDAATGIAVDAAGDAWITGWTYSPNFPVTSSAAQKAYAGGAPPQTSQVNPGGDAFITEINPAGTALLYSSFLGGTGEDSATALSRDANGNIYLTGQTTSTTFPGTPPLAATAPGFVVKLAPSGAILYSTYLDAAGAALAVDSAGAAYITGTVFVGPFTTTPGALQTARAGITDAFVVKLNTDGTHAYSTLLGGSDRDSGLGIAVNSAGEAWVTGNTSSIDFPVTSGRSGTAFIVRLNSAGTAVLLGTAFSKSGSGSAVMLDGRGGIFVTGRAEPSGVPQSPNAIEVASCATTEWFVQEFSPEGALLYSGLSREGPLVTSDSTTRFYVAERVANGARILRVDPSASDRPSTLVCVENAASYLQLGISPGEIVSLFGDRIGPAMPVSSSGASSGLLPTTLGSTSVEFNGVPAPLLYTGPNQINAVTPWALMPSAQATVAVAGASPIDIPVRQSDPGIFQITPSPGGGQGAILNQDGTVNSSSNPAPRGSVISIFATGIGPLDPTPLDGQIIEDAAHLARLPVTVLFSGNADGEVLYAGAAPGFVAGAIQINVRLPQQFGGFPLPGNIAILIRVGDGLLSSVLATVAVQ